MIGKLVLAAIAAPGVSAEVQAADWNGFYAGVPGGLSRASSSDGCPDCDVGLPGIAAVAGYDWDNADNVVGLEKMVVFSFYPDQTNGDVRKVTFLSMLRRHINLARFDQGPATAKPR